MLPVYELASAKCTVQIVYSTNLNCYGCCMFDRRQYHNAEDAKKAMEQLNGFELAGRPMKVGNVTEHNPESSGGSYYDVDDMDRAGFGLGATGRIQLMAKLAEGKVFTAAVCHHAVLLISSVKFSVS